jgi:DNA-binding NarL/FixJ family response regulator
MRVLLADDHLLVRAGLRALLDAMPDVEVVAEVGDGEAAVVAIRELVPDVALVDIAMPGMTGLAVLHDIGPAYPTRILLLSMYDNDEYVLAAIHGGAAGYLLKHSAVGELSLALAAVHQGETYFSPRVSSKIARALVGGADPAGAGLTPRQTEVLRLVALGQSSKEIARTLDLSLKTVETHRAQLMDRLDIHDLASLVRYALRVGLISNER